MSAIQHDVHKSGRYSTMRTLTRIAALAATTLLTAPALAGDGNLVIRAGKILTMTGEVIENGTIVISNGRIQAIGTDVEAPPLYQVLDASDLVAFPGYVEAISNLGMDRENENIDVAPFLDVRDSIDPVNFYFEDALRWGITTINIEQGSHCVVGAQGRVVKPHGMTVEEMTVKPRAGIVLSASPKRGKSHATQAQALRDAFRDLREHLEELVAEKKAGNDRARREALYQGRDPEEVDKPGRPMEGRAWKVEGLELVPRAQIDEKLAPLLDLVEGRRKAFIYCSNPMDVHLALEVAEENGFLENTVLVLEGPRCYRAAEAIAEAGVPVILPSTLVYTERDPITAEETEIFVPQVFVEKQIPFALRSANSSTQSLWFQAALCVGRGMSREQALAAVTTVPARILGLEDKVGSLAPGKLGNVLLLTGDPLSITTHVQRVVIEGDPVYDRATDKRTRFLETGRPAAAATPAGGAEWPPKQICCEGDPEGLHDHEVHLDRGENPPEEQDETSGDGHDH